MVIYKKYYLIMFALAIISVTSYSCQKKSESKEYTDTKYSPLPPSRRINTNNLVGFGCYESGEMSKPVQLFTKLIRSKNYQIIKEKLYSKFPADRYLAAYSLMNLTKDSELEITLRDKNQIDKIKISKYLVDVCSGCTYEKKLSIEELLGTDKGGFSYQTEIWYRDITSR